LLRSDQKLYERDCKACWKYQFHEDGDQKGLPRLWRGEPLRRPEGYPPPCLTKGLSCKKGTIDNQNVLTPTNAKVVMHYRECRAVGDFPDDPTVRANAAIISEVERMLDRVESSQVTEVMQAIAFRGGV